MDLKIILFAAATLLILTLLFLAAAILNFVYYKITGGSWEDEYKEIEYKADQGLNERAIDQENKALR
jgi:hypothetical protein